MFLSCQQEGENTQPLWRTVGSLTQSHTFTMQPPNPRCLPKRHGIHVCSSFIYNCPDLETTQMSLHQSINNVWHFQIVKCFSAVEWNQLQMRRPPQMDFRCLGVSKRSCAPAYTLCLFIYMTFGEKIRRWDRKQISDGQGQGWVGGWHKELFLWPMMKSLDGTLPKSMWLGAKHY